MNRIIRCTASVIAMAMMGSALAQVPANAPKGATALCKDGSFDSTPTRVDACKSRQGVEQWWGKATPSKDDPSKDDRGPHEKTEHPVPVTPPAG